jgi:hypothetical protein
MALFEHMLRSGKIKEELFAKLIQAQMSDLLMDLRGVDLHLTLTFNVKGQKKIRRSDLSPSSIYHWLEIKKHTGQAGWVFKGAHFIVFELDHTWLIVERQRLEELVRHKAVKAICKDPEPYKMYHRKSFKSKAGKCDILTLIPVKDLREVSVFEIAKEQ